MATRNDKGQFVKGHPGGPGRPRREVEHAYHTALVGKVTIEDWQKVVDRAVQDAKDGDHNARVFLAQYLMGKPQEHLDVTSADEQLPIAVIKMDVNEL